MIRAAAGEDGKDALGCLRSELQSLNELLTQLSLTDAEALLNGMAPDDFGPFLGPTAIYLRSRVINHNRLHAFGSQIDDSGGEVSFFPLPVGFTSYDRAAMLGRDGHVFLIGGSNDVLGLYATAGAAVDSLVDQWCDVMQRRREQAERRGIRYHHLVMPEKITILRELFPIPVATPTHLLARLETKIAEDGHRSHYTSGRESLAFGLQSSPVCKRLDSHLSPAGSIAVFGSLLKDLYGIFLPSFNVDERVRSVGDLAYRMLGLFVPEEFRQVSLAHLPHFATRAVKREEHVPDNIHYQGRRQVWINLDAPIQEKVIVFGNSFFSFVENGQSTLAWWFARWFSEYHFVWSNEVDWDYVDEVRPQLVLWQGIERFLQIVPGA